jgi:hypothetical protein
VAIRIAFVVVCWSWWTSAIGPPRRAGGSRKRQASSRLYPGTSRVGRHSMRIRRRRPASTSGVCRDYLRRLSLVLVRGG